MGKNFDIAFKPDSLLPDGQKEYFFIWTGFPEVVNIFIDFLEPGKQFTVTGILLGIADKHVEINVKVRHQAISTRSRIILKGVLTEKSSVKFTGVTRIEQGAKQTDAWLECRLLMLSKQAKGQAIPSLEILENDVKAGHASTAGRINDMELFYLQSRGFSHTAAKRLIAEGFVFSALKDSQMDTAGTRQKLARFLDNLHYGL